jgi:hypothetical protein
VNRFRNLDFRCSVMPLVLAALALRALIPAGFMPGTGEGFGFLAMLCAPQIAGQTAEDPRAAMERFELPASPAAHAQPHCDFCVSPPLGAPPAMEGARIPVQAPSLAPVSFLAQISSHSPDRAPSARAPPA